MLLSNNVNCTVQQLPKDTYINLKRPMFYVVTSSLFLIASMQVVNAATCAPDVKYLLPQLRDSEIIGNVNNLTIDGLIKQSGGNIDSSILEREGEIKYKKDSLNSSSHTSDWISYARDEIMVNEQAVRQLKCRRDGGQFAVSSADFDSSGNFTGSTQQASNKKSKSGKSNNQEQVTSANSNENNTNSTDSNNAESSDAKSKGKEFAKDDKRLHANACVAVQRGKNKVPAFKNICPYPIEVVWCANSKEDPNQCDRGWNGQWNFGVGHSEPIHATSETTHWIVAACKGENSLFVNEELKRNKKVRCVNWKN